MSDFDPSNFDFNLTFDAWVKFVFDRPFTTDDPKSAWYWNSNLIEFWEEWQEKVNPEAHLKYATELFKNPAFLLTAYSPEQINQGFEFLLTGPSSEFALCDLLWRQDLSWPIREQCILSMANVFQVIFTQLSEQDTCYMWWDKIRDYSEEADPKVKEAMLQAMASILQMPLLACQISALHGLGHLRHSGKKAIIENYLARSPNANIKIWPDSDITIHEYSLAAIESNVL